MKAKYFLDLFGGIEEITEQEWDIIFGKMHFIKCPCTVIVTQKFDDNREIYYKEVVLKAGENSESISKKIKDLILL